MSEFEQDVSPVQPPQASAPHGPAITGMALGVGSLVVFLIVLVIFMALVDSFCDESDLAMASCLCACLTVVGAGLAIPATILGVKGSRKAVDNTGRAFALAGKLSGLVSLGVHAAFFLLYMVLFIAFLM